MFAVFNVETGDFYSESPALKNEAKRTGMRWNNASILPCFARPYSRYREALKRSQRLSNATRCICAVVTLGEGGA
ncbi:MAG: hypothetical protein HY938_12025 [Nitrosomonadales bacterium]|nr:hypothetical protein [Nitrosomonadales bacterium]